jgi:DNA-binding NtrC family response regulator
LIKAGENKSRAAEMLDFDRKSLYRKLKDKKGIMGKDDDLHWLIFREEI